MTETLPKETWPPGPWHDEPDEKRWTDETTGLECLVHRGPSGAWCGYVGVPEGHPAHGKDYYRSDFPLEDVLSGKAMKDVHAQHQINSIEVHGGMTYAGSDELRSTDRHWFGFDCAHAGDFCPKYDDISKLGRDTGWGTKEEYRTMDYAMSETASLARQLAAITAKPPSTEAKE